MGGSQLPVSLAYGVQYYGILRDEHVLSPLGVYHASRLEMRLFFIQQINTRVDFKVILEVGAFVDFRARSPGLVRPLITTDSCLHPRWRQITVCCWLYPVAVIKRTS